MHRLADLEVAHIHHNLFRQVFGQATHPDFEKNVLQHAALVLHAIGFADRLHRHLDDDLFILGDFMEIHVQHLASERMVLDFLHQRQPLGSSILLHCQVHQEDLGHRMVD